MNPDCIFCKIAVGDVEARTLYRDDEVIAIEDVHPQAPFHALVIPTGHFDDLQAFTQSATQEQVAKLFAVVAQIGTDAGNEGFRAIVNSGAHGGQTVNHLHVHVLAGRPMRWPPG